MRPSLFRRCLAPLMALATAGPLCAQEQDRAIAESAVAAAKPNQRPLNQFTRVTRPADAVAIALADLTALCTHDAHAAFAVRYIAANEPSPTLKAGLSLAANTALLFSSDARRLIALPGETVFRLNLAEYADYDEKKLRILLDTWDRMEDAQFYLPIDKTVVKNCAPYRLKGDPKVYTAVNAKVQIPAAHADVNGQLSELCTLTGAIVPIVSAGQFCRYTLNSDNGGLYAEFRQFDLAPAKGTAEEAFLLRAGVNLKDLGERNSDQRVILYRNPTANPGFIEYAATAITRPSVGPAIVTITRDFFAGPIQNNKHPFENLLDRKHDGTEIFLPTAAGGLEYALFDGNGGFVRAAPIGNNGQSLAADRTVPAPFLPILQAPSSCIRCHLKQNADAKVFGIYQAAPNYLTWMREARINGQVFDVFADKGDDGKNLQRLVSLFNGETSDAFGYAGRTYSRFCFEASGLPFEEAVNAMLDIHDQWLFSLVTPMKACLMLGYKVESEEAASQLFNTICPPAPEPIRATQLRAWSKERPMGLPIDDLLALYPELALRVQVYEASQQPQPVPQEAQQEAGDAEAAP